MLLSSVALVAKPKTGKNKELTEKKEEDRWINGSPDEACEQCRKEIEEENFVFQFPTAVPNCANTEHCKNSKSYPGDRVNISTGDDFCLSVEKFYYTIALSEETKADITCLFRKKVLETKTVANGRVETVVFALDCDQDFYITTTVHGDLELNYSPWNPRLQEPDERMFDVFYTHIGHVLIQPKLHNNTYLHHLDRSISVQPLDLNWRCPEEYYFHFNAVPESVSKRSPDTKKVCTHNKDYKKTLSAPADLTNRSKQCEDKFSETSDKNCRQELLEYGTKVQQEVSKDSSDKGEIELPTRKQEKSRRAFSNLFFGCFSAKSHRIAVR